MAIDLRMALNDSPWQEPASILALSAKTHAKDHKNDMVFLKIVTSLCDFHVEVCQNGDVYRGAQVTTT